MTGREGNTELFMDHPHQQLKGPGIAGKREVGRPSLKNLPDSLENVLIDLLLPVLRSAIEQRGFPQEAETIYDAPGGRRDTSDRQGCGVTGHSLTDLEEYPAPNTDISVARLAIELLKPPSDWAAEMDRRSHFETSPSLCRLPNQLWDKEIQRRSPSLSAPSQFRYFDSCEAI
jgi:hypothetical protein